MNVNLIFEIAGIGLAVAVAEKLLAQSGREDQAMYVMMGGTLVVLGILVTEIYHLFARVRSLFRI